jgi:hypothetical protein
LAMPYSMASLICSNSKSGNLKIIRLSIFRNL